MNNLEKINALIADGSRSIVYGKPQEAAAGTVISLSVGENDSAKYSMGDRLSACYTTVKVIAYADSYLAGYDALLAIKNDILTAVKSTVNISFVSFGESEYDADMQKQVITTKYKIIE